MASSSPIPDFDALANFAIGRAVLQALVLAATIGLFLASLFLCRQRADRARSVVRWMKAALFFTGVLAFFEVIYSALYVVFVKNYMAPGLLNIFGPLASAFMIVHKTLILATLSSFARGLLFARAGKRAKLAMPVALVTYVLTAVNCVLAVAYLGVALWIAFADFGYQSDWISIQVHANRIHSVPLILVFIGSLASLAASLFVFIKVKTNYPTLKSPSIIYIVASFFFFVSSLYEIIRIGLYVPLSPTPVSTMTQPYVQIVSVFFNTLPALLALVAVFHTTRLKDGGLGTVKGVGSGVVYNPAPGFGFQGQQPMAQPVQGQPMQGQPMAQPSGQPVQGQPMAQPSGQPVQGQPMGQPMQSPPAGYQGGFFPQGAQPQGWQPQVYYYAPPGQQQQFAPGQQPQGQQAPQQVAQSPPAQVPSPASEVQTEHVNPHIKY